MRILLVLSFVVLALFAACDEDPSSSNGMVIDFNPDKCGCCWGWTLEVDGEIIKSADVVIGELVGYDIKEPIPVTIELGMQEISCSEYYDVNSISLE